MTKTITISPALARKYPTLVDALSFGNGHGTCVQRASALMLDMPGAELVFAIVRAGTPEEQQAGSHISPVPFIHAWVEQAGQVYAPTLIERMDGDLRPLPVDVYYRSNGVKRTWRLPRPAFMLVAKRWKLAASFKHRSQRAGRGEVADALLRAAGVRYVLSNRNTILPHPSLLTEPA